MNVFSLRTVIDDILLIVRNNNISESEDLSRDQIRAWVMDYKAYLNKKKLDKDKELGDDSDYDDSISSTIGPLKLLNEPSSDECFRIKRTKDKLPELFGNSDDNIVSVVDGNNCLIQFMNSVRRHYHKFRRYTFAEPTCRYEHGYIYVEGFPLEDINEIYVEGNFMDDESGSEDDVLIPGWMIPDIKKAVLENELSFMVGRPSDDSNNSTLASVKPHGPQDLEE